MSRLRLTIDLEYDADLMHGNDPEGVEWFRETVLGNSLVLHSDEIGDYIGTVTVVSVEGSDQ